MPEDKFKSVPMLNEQESIMQIAPFGQGSIALLTTSSRVLVPGAAYGKWFELPTPPPFSSSEQ